MPYLFGWNLIFRKHLSLLRTVIVAFLSVCYLGVEADWHNMVINYGRNDFGRATQTWKVCPAQDQYVFFANKDGIFQYDYSQWQKHSITDQIGVRSALVSPDDKRIYVGAINEFGYFELAPNGDLHYVSLSNDQLENEVRYAGNVWDVHKHGHTLYFRTEDRVIRVENDQYDVLWPGYNIRYSCMIDDALHIATSKGLHVLMGSKFFTIHGSEAVAKHRICGVIPQGKNYLVFTSDDGAYLLDGFTATPVPTEADQFMRENEVYCIANSKDKLAVGTVRGGLVVMDRDGKNPVYYNENTGLQNNTVLSMAFDSEGNLWAGLDRGISCINMSMPFKELTGSGERIGLGYTAATHHGTLYLGTNRGLYRQQQSDSAPIVPVAGVAGQVWDLCHVDDELYCATDHGIYALYDGAAAKVPGISSAWTLQQMRNNPDKVYIGTYTGLWVADRVNGTLVPSHQVEGMRNSFQHFEQGVDNEVWLANVSQLARVEMNKERTEVLSQKIYELPVGNNDSFSGAESQLTFLPGSNPLSVLSPNGIFTYDVEADSFVPDTVLNHKYIGNHEYLSAACAFGKYYLLSSNQLTIFPEDLQGEKKVYPFSSSLIEMIQGFERVFPITHACAIMPSERGFMLFTAPDSLAPQSLHRFCIRHISSVTGKDSTLYSSNFMGEKPEIRIKPGYNSILAALAADNLIDGIQYQCRLNGKQWSAPSLVPMKQYMNLSPGSYTLEARAIYPDGTVQTDSVQFYVITPWYRTWWAIGIYCLIAIGLVWWLVRWDKKRTLAREAQAVKEKEEEMRQMEEQLEGEIARKEGEIAIKEDEIARQQENIENLEKQRLEDQLKHKSLEMANMMVNVVQTNETLGNIKRDIGKVLEQLKGNDARDLRKQLMSITSSIDDNINSQEVMGKIEEQFDMLHDNFMTRLTEKYPSLTVNERMMCGYLKMHLSTKEIAQLFNMSVRGVETVRYRLRKKLELTREQSLTDFIDSI
ncbi:MAG: transcriptional regulator [Bacteroidales bacterium]|nr:transcriptional regulator [Bacteroidales bacterium]